MTHIKNYLIYIKNYLTHIKSYLSAPLLIDETEMVGENYCTSG